MKVIKLVIIFLLTFVSAEKSIAADTQLVKLTIRIAIIDNFHFQPNITNQYYKYYMPGFKVAQYQAESMGYNLEYKVFNYDSNPLSVLKTIPMVKEWRPDLIIGPRNSNVFLLLGSSFSNILVLSPFATSMNISKMPKNFYSLTAPVQYTSQAIDKYLNEKYPGVSIFGIIQADCKNCIDLSQEFSKFYSGNNKAQLHYEYITQDQLSSLDFKNLMAKYQKNSIVFLPNESYLSAVLMVEITNFLNQSTIFIGGDDWGTWRNTEVGKISAGQPYRALHITPWSLDVKTSELSNFKQQYYAVYHNYPDDTAAYIAYNSVYSVLVALKQYKSSSNSQGLNIKEQILDSYMLALANNPNWFRPNIYAVYLVDRMGEYFVAPIEVSLSK